MIWLREQIERLPSFNHFSDQITTIENTIEKNPALCIETSKALIEGICKTILENKKKSFNSDTVQGLVKQTTETLVGDEQNYHDNLIALCRKISAVVQEIATIRNNAGFASHGQDIDVPQMDKTLSLFVSRATDLICSFILDVYINQRDRNKDCRIHYEDNEPFNQELDDENPIGRKDMILSFSKALFQQDYEAYKEELFEYMDKIQLLKESKKEG
ncbi:MAG: abortive infection family protein [Treponema sp.]